MENKEYYTPDRTDFFIGYEYEYESNNVYGGDKWIKAKFSLREVGEFDEGFMLDFLLEKEMIRVPYLTKDQIEKEGWKKVFEDNLSIKFIKNEWLCILSEYTHEWVNKKAIHKPRIEIHSTGDIKRQFIECRCYSINEFRKITKWLGI